MISNTTDSNLELAKKNFMMIFNYLQKKKKREKIFYIKYLVTTRQVKFSTCQLRKRSFLWKVIIWVEGRLQNQLQNLEKVVAPYWVHCITTYCSIQKNLLGNIEF